MTAAWLHTYPYLATCLGGLMITGAALMAFPAQRIPALVSGLLGMPFGLAGIWLVPAYWKPHLVWSVHRVGCEDLVFSFIAATLVWLLATWRWRERVRPRFRRGRVAAGYAGMILLGLPCFGTAWWLLADPMAAVLVTLANGVVFFLILRPGHWRLAAAGSAGFGLVHVLLIKIWFWLFPAFASSWPATGPWSGQVWGVPWGELAWAGAYGACWPLWMAFLMQTDILKEPA